MSVSVIKSFTFIRQHIQQSTNCRGASSMFRNLPPFGHRALILTESSVRAGRGVTIDKTDLELVAKPYGQPWQFYWSIDRPRLAVILQSSPSQQLTSEERLGSMQNILKTEMQNKEKEREGSRPVALMTYSEKEDPARSDCQMDRSTRATLFRSWYEQILFVKSRLRPTIVCLRLCMASNP